MLRVTNISLVQVNPPKPERESNRRRKKKSLDEDFIDISDPGSLYLLDYQPQSSSKARLSIYLFYLKINFKIFKKIKSVCFELFYLNDVLKFKHLIICP